MAPALRDIGGIARTLAAETGARFVETWHVPAAWRTPDQTHFTRQGYAALAGMLPPLCR